MRTFAYFFLQCCSVSPKDHKTNARGMENDKRRAIGSEGWPLMFQDKENPMSADSAGLYINRVINRSITHSEEDSVRR